MAAASGDLDVVVDAGAEADAVLESVVGHRAVGVAIRVEDPEPVGGPLGEDGPQGTEQVRRHGAGGCRGEGVVPERVDPGAAHERLAGHHLDHVELAEEHRGPLAEGLSEVEARDVEGIRAVDSRRVERRVRRDQDAGLPVHGVAEVEVGLHGHREAVPEAEPAEVESDAQVGLAAILVALLAVAGGDPLVELGQPGLDGDAVLLQPGPAAAPVAGERVALREAVRISGLLGPGARAREEGAARAS